MKTWRIMVAEAPPSANVFMRTHFRRRAKLKEAWGYLLLAAGVRDIPPAKANRIVYVTVTSKKQRDHANLWLGVDKLILDNLVGFGVLKDDSPRFCDVIVKGKVGDRATEIEIREVGL